MNVEKYRGLFIEEAREHLSALARELASPAPPGRPAIDSLFRHAHSIKGMSASMGVQAMRDLAHAMEDLLGQARKGTRELGPTELDRLLAAADLLADQLAAWERGGPVPVGADAIARLSEAPGSLPELELLPALAIEPASSGAPELVPAAATTELVAEPARPAATPPQPAAPVPSPERSTVRVATAFLDALLDRVTELALVQGSLRSAFGAEPSEPGRRALESLRRSVDRLREDTTSIRLLPFSTIAPDLARAARDAVASTGKPARLTVTGGEVALDRSVVESLADPLVHLIRNAVDHGLEAAAARRTAGKPAEGEITIAVRREADSVYVAVRDDGRGMDPDALAERAVSDGRMSPAEAARLGRSEKLLLATLPGLSTAAAVTSLSGRGVGLDLVRARVEGLGGKLEIDSEPGRSTEITLRAPLTLALQRLFLVRSGRSRYAVPVARVAGLFQLQPHEIRPAGRGWVADLDDDETLPFVPLAPVLGGLFAPPERSLAGLLLEARGRRAVLGVDEALSEAELVVRPLGRPLQRLAAYSAAAILPEGRLALVLDVDGLIRL